MLLKTFVLLSVCQATGDVELASDHSPESVFEPIETRGVPAIPNIISGSPKKMWDDVAEKATPEPIHLEQLIGYQQTPCQEGETGFIVVG